VTARPVHLLVDAGVDDALAVLAASLHPRLELAAVTAAAGNVSLARSAANATYVLQVLDVPVALSRGAAMRSDGRPFPPRGVHGPDGLAGVGPTAVLPSSTLAAVPTFAEHRASAGPSSARPIAPLLVCLAPMTSLLHLDVPDEPCDVVATYARPDEANHVMDPAAADQVRSGWHVIDAACEDPLLPPTALARTTPVEALAVALLEHQRRRGAGLGDADVLLRLAGETNPVGAFGRLLADMPGRVSS